MIIGGDSKCSKYIESLKTCSFFDKSDGDLTILGRGNI